MLASSIALLLFVLLAVYLGRVRTPGAPNAVSWIAVGLAVALVVVRTVLRRR